MLVLFGNGTPRTLARYLIDRHTGTEARVARMSDLLVATSGNGRPAYRFAHAGYTIHRRRDWVCGGLVRDEIGGRRNHVASPHRSPTSANHSSSVSTATPASRALSSFDPAPGPATT